jgi:hypothetical protein
MGQKVPAGNTRQTMASFEITEDGVRLIKKRR